MRLVVNSCVEYDVNQKQNADRGDAVALNHVHDMHQFYLQKCFLFGGRQGAASISTTVRLTDLSNVLYAADIAVQPVSFYLIERAGLADVITLRIIDADHPDMVECFACLDVLGDGLDIHDAAYLVDGGDHGATDLVVADILYDAAIDLQIIDRQVLQIGE